MTDLQIKMLSANNKSALNLDSLKLFNKIKKEHIFISIPDALNSIWEVLSKPINPDNPGMISGGDTLSPLFINVIDDGICSILYEMYHADSGESVLNMQSLLMRFASTVEVYKPIHTSNDGRISIIASKIGKLFEIIGLNGLDLTNRRAISLYYYDIMHFLYTNKKIKTKDDNIIIDYYKQLFNGVYTNPFSH